MIQIRDYKPNNLNTGGNNFDESEGVIATNSIHHGGKSLSKIVLPIVKK